jgi:hypothetical protein
MSLSTAYMVDSHDPFDCFSLGFVVSILFVLADIYIVFGIVLSILFVLADIYIVFGIV